MAANNKSRYVKVNPEEVTFGVEIECRLPDLFIHEQRISIGSYHHGDLLPPPFPTGWNAQEDGSLGHRGSGYTPLEIVSPVLRGSAGIRQVVEVMEILRNAGMRVNSHCGFHVHVGVCSLLGASIEESPVAVRFLHRLLNLVSVYEFGMFATINDHHRIGNTYCESVKSQSAKLIATTDSMDGVKQKIGHRYHTLNLVNLLHRKMTVEFRLFAGTTDPMQAVGYITTAIGLCHRAAEFPQAPQFDASTTCTDWIKAGADLLFALGQTTKSGHRYGWPVETWKAFGAAVTQLQIENAKAFARTMNRRRQQA